MLSNALIIFFLCIFPSVIYMIYRMTSSFSNKYICVKSIYTMSGKIFQQRLVILDLDDNKYIFDYHSNDSSSVELVPNINTGDHIIISGYGYNSNMINLHYVITSIKFS